MLLGMIGVPRLTSLYGSIDKRTGEMNLLDDIRYSQALAVEEGCQGIIKIASDAHSYSFGCDYVPFSTDNPPVWDTLKFTGSLPTGITLATTGETLSGVIIFNTRG